MATAWLGGSIQWRSSFDQIRKFLDHVVLQGHDRLYQY